jgi:hypothetical protein
MKRVVLALILAVAGLVATDASARCFRNGCSTRSYGYRACETACRPACKPACRPNYKVIDVPPCEAPCCVRWVKVKEPAICIRECRWVCPTNCVEESSAEANDVQ